MECEKCKMKLMLKRIESQRGVFKDAFVCVNNKCAGGTFKWKMNNEQKKNYKLSRLMSHVGFIIGVWSSYGFPSIKNKIGISIVVVVLISFNDLIKIDK